MTLRRWIKAAACIVAATVLAAAAALVLLPRLIDLDDYRQEILSSAQSALNRRVAYRSASLSWNLVPAIVFRGIAIAEKTGTGNTLEADKVGVRLALLPLLRHEIRIKELTVDRPVLTLVRDRSGAFNIEDLLEEKGKPSRFQTTVKSIRIQRGTVRFTDHLADPAGLATLFEGLTLEGSGLARGERCVFKFSTRVAEAVTPTTIGLSGTALLPGKGKAERDVKLDVRVVANNINAVRYWPYYARYVPFKRLTGRIDYAATFQGKLDDFTSKGDLWTRGLRFDYPRVFHAVLAPRDLHLSYELALTPRDLSVNTFSLNVDALSVNGSCLLRDIHSGDLRITAKATTSPFRLEEFHQYIPYGVIVKGPAEFIEQHIKGGVYRLDDGRLDGRVSQISSMGVGDNYNVLYIRGRVKNGVVAFRGVPPFNRIDGELELRGKDFILRGMTGSFGDAPFNLEGRIADYPLAGPASYPFTMVARPTKREVAWLLRQQEGAHLDFAGQSTVRLTGTGTGDDYRLAGSWDLTGASYRYGGVMQKPGGTANSLRFAARLNGEEALLEAFRFQLPPLDIKAGARYRYDARSPLVFSAQTNRFPVAPLLYLAPGLRQYSPSGSMEARGSGSGNPGTPEGMTFDGELAVAGLSARPWARVEALHDVNGTIHMTDAALETQKITGSVGSSRFELRGRVSGFANPAAEAVFSSPDVRPTDLGYRCSGDCPTVKEVAGKIALRDGKLNIESLTGKANGTAFSMSGSVATTAPSKMDLRVDFPYLAAENLVPFAKLERAEGAGPAIAVTSRMTAAAGRVRDIPFEKLDTTLSLENDLLQVKSAAIGLFGGSISGSGKADFSTKKPKYEATYVAAGLDAEEIQQAAGVEPYLSGALTAEGDLAAQGNSAVELMDSANVTASVHVDEGRINAAGEIPFDAADADLSFEKRSLTVENLQAAMLGGEVAGDLQADFGAKGGPVYTGSYIVSGIDAERAEEAAGVALRLVGKLDATGELTARGKSVAELEESARATSKIHIDRGQPQASAATGTANATPTPYGALDADLSYAKKVLTADKVSATLFGGTMTGTGAVDFGADAGPAFQVQYSLARVDAAELLKAAGAPGKVTGMLTAQGELTGRGSNREDFKRTAAGYAALDLVDGSVNVGAVIPVREVRSRVSFRNRAVGIEPTTIEAFGGVITGKGEIDYAVAGGPGYGLICDIKGVRATDFFNVFGVTKELSGHLDLQADLTARGGTETDLKRTLNGKVGMHLEKGVINKYPLLSKVFSILNVSQLFRFKLPDMVMNGMPYDRIDATFLLRDGVAHSNDLTLTSPSVNITAVGKSDLVRREIDIEMGVQPLQTVGKVVGRIPIVGWILTGGNRRFLVTYFDAKGKWDDPKVTTTTAKALPEGVYNIFKRVFQLPGRLVTEPREVIMGN